jgi:putative peptidoglycan lipid II flippase
MAAVTVVSRVTGYLRDKVVAALLGAGPVADAFYAGLAVPNMFRALLAEGALHAAFIPTLSEMRERGDAEAQRRFVRAMTAALLLTLPVIVGLGVLAAPVLVRLFAPGFSGSGTLDLAVRFTRQMFPYLGLISLAGLAQGVLNASGRFLLPAATPIALNLLVVAGTLLAVHLGAAWGWMAGGVVAGGLAQLLLLWTACRRSGLPLLPGGGGFRHPEVRRVLALMLPGIPALGVYQITLLLSYRFASAVGPGAVTAKFNAARLSELFYGVLIVQLTTAVLPMLAADRARDVERARGTLAFAVRLLSLVALPASVLLAVLARPIVGTALGGGQYGAAAVAVTAAALAMYGLGLPFLGLTKLLSATSYAWKDTRQPVLAAAVNLVTFYALGALWTPVYGVPGIAGAAAAGQAANALSLLALNARAGRLPAARAVLPSVVRHLAAATLMGIVLHFAAAALPPMTVTSLRSVALLAGLGSVALATYAVALVALRATEWDELRAEWARRRQR